MSTTDLSLGLLFSHIINDVIKNKKNFLSVIEMFLFRYLETENLWIFPNSGTLLKIVPNQIIAKSNTFFHPIDLIYVLF